MTILLTGLGQLGYHILLFLARTPGIKEIVTADFNEKIGIDRTNSAINAAAHGGLYPKIRFIHLDQSDVESTAEILKEIEPDVICGSASTSTWWTQFLLPLKAQQKIYEMSPTAVPSTMIMLPYKLMLAVKKSGIKTHVVQAAYADQMNPLLASVGYPPTTGAGNLDLMIPWIQKYVSEKLKVPMRDVTVYLVMHHATIRTMGQAPFWVKILVRDKNVTDKFPTVEIAKHLPIIYGPPKEDVKELPITMNGLGQANIAASFVKNVLAIYFNTREICHAPGPNGLPGGYPVRLSAEGAEVVLPEEITLDEAIKINKKAARFEGWEDIKKGGTIVYTDEAVKNTIKLYGVGYKEIKFEEIEEKAKEMMQLRNKFIEKYL